MAPTSPKRPVQQLNLQPEDMALVTEGYWLNALMPTQPITHIATHSQLVQIHDCFLALRGERFDAHQFLQSVIESGARSLVVSTPQPELAVPQLVVKDTRIALGQLAKLHKSSMPHVRVVALTGSSGKTTTKELLGAILNHVAPTLVTRGNLNNDLGVPMMMLELQLHHQFAVFELGANHIGEIEYTSKLVQPHVAAVLNIGTAHIGEFGGREGIARAKSEIFLGLQPSGIAITPSEDDFAALLQHAAAQHTLYQFGASAHFSAHHTQLTQTECHFQAHCLLPTERTLNIHVPLAGQHNVYNTLAAIAMASALHISDTAIVEGIQHTQGAKGRLNFHHFPQITLIDDTYNANPTSMVAAAQVLKMQEGLHIMVVGDMAELGETAAQQHAETGAAFAKQDIDIVIAVGEYAAHVHQGFQQQGGQQSYAFADKTDAAALLQSLLTQRQSTQQHTALLVKGSRGSTMETVIADLYAKMHWE